MYLSVQTCSASLPSPAVTGSPISSELTGRSYLCSGVLFLGRNAQGADATCRLFCFSIHCPRAVSHCLCLFVLPVSHLEKQKLEQKEGDKELVYIEAG